MGSTQVHPAQCGVRHDRMYHAAELSSSLELVIDVTPQIYAPNDVISGCVDFLESHSVAEDGIQAFRLLISEALANAIEHGILCLPSSLKEDPFHPYHEVLRSRLNDVGPGQVFLKVRLLHENGNCDLIRAIGVEVSDSGPGFDWQGYMCDLKMPDSERSFGRGLALIKMIARHVSFNESGNTISFIVPCEADAPTGGPDAGH